MDGSINGRYDECVNSTFFEKKLRTRANNKQKSQRTFRSNAHIFSRTINFSMIEQIKIQSQYMENQVSGDAAFQAFSTIERTDNVLIDDAIYTNT